MRFIRRYQYQILCIAVLFLCTILVIRGFQAESSAHVQRREDFLVLCEEGQLQASERSYQILIQELPDLSDRLLSEDLQRTAMLVEKKPKQDDLKQDDLKQDDLKQDDLKQDDLKQDNHEQDNLIRKYHVSVGNELRTRAKRRLAEAQDNAK